RTMRMLKRVLAVIGVLVLLVVGVSVWLFARGGAFRDLEPGFAGVCRDLPLEASAEDMQVDHDRRFLYVSYMDRLGMIAGDDVQGTIMRIDLGRLPLEPQDALLDRPDHLRTHGLSLHVDEDGQRFLHVINHPVDRSSEPELVE